MVCFKHAMLVYLVYTFHKQILVIIDPFIFIPVVQELGVSIIQSPDSDNYQAGSFLSLTCHVDEGHPPFSYHWNSTCTGDCFVVGQGTQSVSRDALMSIDSGTHTCYVQDYAGHSGSADISISVTGNDSINSYIKFSLHH